MRRFASRRVSRTAGWIAFSALLGLPGCGDPATAGGDASAQTPPTAGQPNTSATGVPVIGAEQPAPAPATPTPPDSTPGSAASSPAAETLPAPSRAIDGFETMPGWLIADFGNPGQVNTVKPSYTVPQPNDKLALAVNYTPGDKNKLCLKHDCQLAFQPTGNITTVVFNHAPADIALAVAFSTGENFDWFESLPQIAKPGWNTLTWKIEAGTWKSAASQWQNTALLANPGSVRAMHLLIYNEHRTGRLTVSSLTMDLIPPKAPPPTAPTAPQDGGPAQAHAPATPPTAPAAVDWDTLVAQLPVNPLGHVKGFQSGTWVNEMTGDPARVLVAPSALSATADRMLVLDWPAAGSSPQARKKQFVGAKQMFYPVLPLDKTGVIAFDVYNASASETTISLGIITGDVAAYHESKPVKLAAQAWTTVKLPLDGTEYKSAATKWEPTGTLAGADKLTGLIVKAFTTDQPGRLMVTALTAPVVTPPPTPQPMPPVDPAPPAVTTPEVPAPAPQPAPAPAPAPEAPALEGPVPQPAPEAPAP